ncbi:MAG TPA: hypothetical protein VGD45_25805 [Steroidobacter sp.]|uniref:hypothetical protein n=1 Tax=Steroidobacter sp. TaxID=1978227 RepID=UPI002EDAFC1E
MHQIFAILIHVLMLAALAVTFFKMRQARRRQDHLLAELRDTPNWTRIYINRPAHSARLLKLLPYEARGLLVDEGETVRVLGEISSGGRIDRRYSKANMSLRWVGNARLADGNLHWIAIGDGADALTISADTGLNPAASRDASADIVRRLAPDLELPQSAKGEFALETNRRSLGVVIAFFVLGAFALFDGAMLNHNVLLNGDSIMVMAPFIGLLALTCYPILTRGGVPARESWAISWLLGMALGFAFVPLVKRADQWAAGNSTQTVVYELQARGRLIPVNSAAPPIDYAQFHEFWDQFERGSSHELQLIHGPFGLWQLDESDLRPRMRAFYEKRRRTRS